MMVGDVTKAAECLFYRNLVAADAAVTFNESFHAQIQRTPRWWASSG